MSKKKKKEQREDLSAPYAYVKAQRMLNIAEKYALERKDPGAMTDVANSWIEIGQHLLTAEMVLVYDEDDDTPETEEEPFVVGFAVPIESGDNDGEEEVEPTPGTTENSCEPGVH